MRPRVWVIAIAILTRCREVSITLSGAVTLKKATDVSTATVFAIATTSPRSRDERTQAIAATTRLRTAVLPTSDQVPDGVKAAQLAPLHAVAIGAETTSRRGASGLLATPLTPPVVSPSSVTGAIASPPAPAPGHGATVPRPS